MKYRLGILAVALLALVGCAGLNLTVVRGSGNVVTESRAVSNFNRVALSGIGELAITQGDTEALTVEADDNLLPLIVTQVRNNVLNIGIDPNRGVISPTPSRPIKFALRVKNLDSIQLSGAGNISVPALKTDTLTVGSSGAGNINITQLDAKTLNGSVSGVGNLVISGQVETQDASLSGLGSYTAGDLKSTSTAVSISGAGSATVWAAQTLNVRISGAGSVSYYGTPQVTQSISGLGNVKSLGNK